MLLVCDPPGLNVPGESESERSFPVAFSLTVPNFRRSRRRQPPRPEAAVPGRSRLLASCMVGAILAPVATVLIEPLVVEVPTVSAAAATSILVDFEGHSPEVDEGLVCALETGPDSVWCWGVLAPWVTGNTSYSTTNKDTAIKTPDGLVADGGFVNADVDDLAVAGSSACVVKDGSVYCWGKNEYGELGDGTAGAGNGSNAYLTPKKVPDIGGFVNTKIISVVGSKMSGGTSYAAFCVIRDPDANDDGSGGDGDGVVYCWGSNHGAKLGIDVGGFPTTTNQTTPVIVGANNGFLNTDVTQVALSMAHQCVIESGVVYCAGNQFNGALGNGVATGNSLVVKVQDGAAGGVNDPPPSTAFTNANVTAIAVSGMPYTCVVKPESVGGMAFCWGYSTSANSGPSSTNRFMPQVNSLFGPWNLPRPIQDAEFSFTPPLSIPNASVSAVVLSGYSGCITVAVPTGDEVACWGTEGAVGRGLSNPSAGVPRDKVSTTSAFANSGVSGLSASGQVTCADEGGYVYCWGNSTTTMGSGVATNDYKPYRVQVRYYGPSAPTNLAEVSNDATTGEVTVSFTASTASALTSLYDYQYSLDGGNTWRSTTPTTSASPIVLRLPSATYSLQLRARSTVDADPTIAPIAGDASTTLSVTASCTTCPTVTSVSPSTLVPGDQVTITGTNFSNPGSLTLSGIVCPIDSSTSTQIVCTLPLVGTPVGNAISFLNNGQAVAIGGSPTVTWATVPRPPSSVVLTPSDGQIVANFVAPVSPDGTAISNYEYSLDGGSTWQAFNPAISISPVTVSGLPTGSYDVALRAVNGSGAGDATTPSTVAVTCAGCPAAPTDLVPRPGNPAFVEIDFTAPAAPAGTTITNYEYTTTSGQTWVSMSPAVTSGPVTVAATIWVASPSQPLDVALRAMATRASDNAVFPGSTSVTVSVKPRVPWRPSSVTLTPRDAGLGINLATPFSPQGSITDLEYSLDGGSTWISSGVPVGPLSVTGLANGTYQVSVRGVNGSGAGVASLPQSVTVTCATCPDAPTDVVATPGNGLAVLTYTGPTPVGTSFIDRYEYTTTSGLTWATLASPTISGLTNFTTYTISVRAVARGAAGVGFAYYNGAAAAPVSVTPGLPSEPRNVVATAGDTEVTLAFDEPTFTGVNPITNYEYTTTSGVTWAALSPAATTSPITLTGLTNGTSYTVALRAVNDDGPGVASDPDTATPVAPGAGTAPPAPPSTVADPVTPVTPGVPGVTGPRPVAPPTPGTPPRLVTADDVPTLQRPPGQATAVRDGVVTPVVVRAVPEDVASTPPQSRTPQQVAAIRSTAREILARLDLPGDEDDTESGSDTPTPRVEVVETDTGAQLTGVIVDPRDGVTPVPVPVEDVRVVEVGDTRVLLAAADYRGAPARVVNGVLEVTEGGAVAALASGLPAGAPGEVVVLSTPQLMGSFTSDASGRFAGQLELPDGLEPGPHTVVLTSGGITVSLGVIVNADPDVLPVRALDTRTGTAAGEGRIAAGETRRIPLAATPGVPGDAASVMVNVTVVDPSAAGYVTLYACSDVDPEVSTVNFAAGETVANTAILGLGDGELCAYASAELDLVVDVLESRDRGFTPVEPERLLDTRDVGYSRPPAGSVTAVVVTGRAGIPVDAAAVVLNVTVVEADGWGFATVYPCNGVPNTSNLNYTTGATRANLVVTAPAANGTVCVSTYAGADVIVDVFGWYDTQFVPVTHGRLLDTRASNSTVDGESAGAGAVAGNEVIRVRLAGRGGLGPDVATVAVNLTVVDTRGRGWARLWACDSDEPDTSNVNFVEGDTRANAVQVALAGGSDVCIRSTATAHVLLDVTGAFSD